MTGSDVLEAVSQARTPAGRRWRRWLLFGVGTSVVLLLAGALAGLFGRDPGAVRSVLLGRPAPPLVGTTLAGGEFDLRDERGQVVLVNVWASWCEACKAEHPVLMAAQEQLGPLGLQVVGIDMKDDPDEARAFLRERGGERYPNVLDADARKAVEWGTFAVPETYVVDREGTIREKAVGAITAEWVQTTVIPILEEGSP